MDMLKYALHLGGVLVDEQEEQEHAVCFCCPDLEALVVLSNIMVEQAEDAEELEAYMQDAEHVELRKAIASHKCMPEFARQVAEKNPALAAKWMESYSRGAE